MRAIKFLFVAMFMIGLSGCASEFREYDGPEVTRVLVYKAERQMFLMHHDRVLRNYRIGLGFTPEGDKKFEGDGRTPEGHYLIDKRNPDSLYHLSIGISYPNVYDIAEARAMGKDPGGDIFIHGRGPSYLEGLPEDWTWGCIAVDDQQIEHIYAMVPNGTPISIYP